MCDNKLECYDPLFHCDGKIADCSDRSDEIDCNNDSLRRFNLVVFWIIGILTVFHIFIN